MSLTEIILFESEDEFASCLEELLYEFEVCVHRVFSYEELMIQLREGRIRRLICDLPDNNQKTENLLRTLALLQRPPEKTVFTSIYNDLERWPLLAECKGDWIFIPKPFRTQEMTSFLLSDSRRAVHPEGA